MVGGAQAPPHWKKHEEINSERIQLLSIFQFETSADCPALHGPEAIIQSAAWNWGVVNVQGTAAFLNPKDMKNL